MMTQQLDSSPRMGLQRVENAVLELLHRNPQGLRNIQVTNNLGWVRGFVAGTGII